MRVRVAIAVALAGLLLGGATGLFMGLPRLAQHVAVRAVSRVAGSFGQQARWERLELFGYERVTLKGFELHADPADADAPPLLRVDRIEVKLDPSTVLSGKVRVDEIELERPHLDLRIDERGHANYEAALARLERLIRPAEEADGADRAEASSSRSPLRYLVRAMPTVRVVDASLELRVLDPTHRLGPADGLSITEGKIEAEDAGPGAGALDLRVRASGKTHGATVVATGRWRRPRQDLELELALEGPLRMPLGERELALGRATWSVGAPLRLESLSLGPAGVASDGSARDTATARRVELHLDESEPWTSLTSVRALRAAVRAVHVFEPELSVRRAADGSSNLDDLVTLLGRTRPDHRPPAAARQVEGSVLPPSPGTARAGEVPPSDRVRVALERTFEGVARRAALAADLLTTLGGAVPRVTLHVTDGRVRWVDERWMEAEHEERIEKLSVRLERLQGSATSEISVRFSAEDTERGPRDNALTLRVDTESGDAQLDLSVTSLPLLSYAPVLPTRVVPTPDTVLYRTRLNALWSAASRTWRAEGSVRAKALALVAESVATQPIYFADVGLDFDATLDLQQQRLTLERLTAHLGAAATTVRGQVESLVDAPRFDLTVRVPPTPIQALFDGLPPQLVPALDGLRIAGTLGWSARVKADSADWPSIAIDAEAATLKGVAVQSMGGQVRFASLRGPFLHRVEEPDGSVHEFTSGPGARDYALYRDISPWMTEVITTTEDGRFFRHRGFSPQAIRESIVSNLTKARFARGASTVTQQLAKNLYLPRSKTIARKLQEAIIAWQMEEHLTKKEILELYFNVIEFGPSLYGISRASWHYFRKPPRDLDVLECLFLASLIPNPKKYYAQYKRGEVSDAWKARLRYLGRAMLERGKITEAQFEAMGSFSPRFWNSPPRGDDALARILDNLDPPGDDDELPTLGREADQGEPGILFDPSEHP